MVAAGYTVWCCDFQVSGRRPTIEDKESDYVPMKGLKRDKGARRLVGKYLERVLGLERSF